MKMSHEDRSARKEDTTAYCTSCWKMVDVYKPQFLGLPDGSDNKLMVGNCRLCGAEVRSVRCVRDWCKRCNLEVRPFSLRELGGCRCAGQPTPT